MTFKDKHALETLPDRIATLEAEVARLNTVLAKDAFTLNEVQQSNKQLAQQRQSLQEDIAREESPENLAKRARALGMVEPALPAFIDSRTGKITGSSKKPSKP